MDFGEITIRRSVREDDAEIRRVLHSGSRLPDWERLCSEQESVYLLLHQHKLIAVLCADMEAAGQPVHWMVVHPMYPRRSVESGMLNTIFGVVCRQP